MTAQATIDMLPGRELSPADGLLRKHVRPQARRSAHYLERFDRTTLFYDAVWLPDRDAHLITAPRFLNLWPVFRDGLRSDGRPVRPRARRTWLRCEQVEIPAPRAGLTLDLPGGPHPIVPRDPLVARFSGLDCLVAVSKNNALDWIRSWARWHARGHGTRGVVLFDNGSTDYDLAALRDALAGVDGLEQVAVLGAPFPYGPNDKSGRFDVSPRFFQSAMLNIARRDALSGARSVLSIDIDEIVRSASGRSVHDLAAGHPLGMVTIRGSWVYPAPDTDGPRPQAAHTWRAVPDEKCNRKWCLRPGGLMDRFGWAVHEIGGILQYLFTEQRDARLLHCRATSTGWKKSRFKKMPEKLVEDPDLVTFMAAAMGPAALADGPPDTSSATAADTSHVARAPTRAGGLHGVVE